MDGLEILDWDSEFFGVRIAALGPGLDPAGFTAALEHGRKQGVACVYLRCDVGDLATLRLAQERGFRLLDVRLTYAAKLGALAIQSGAQAGIRPAQVRDVPALRAIAAESHHASRFYADGRFARERCDELYATWIEKSCAGWADVVFVAEHAGQPAGYLACHRRPAGPGEIGLLGIDARARGLGLGRALVDRALAWFADEGLREVSVVTQGRSIDAQRLYQSAGFRSAKVELWHHLWFRDLDRA